MLKPKDWEKKRHTKQNGQLIIAEKHLYQLVTKF